MASTYTGNAGSVSLTSAVTETLPSDGDALAVASVNTPLQRLADYEEALRQRLNSSGARAWAAFSTAAGAVTIISSYNVSTIAISASDVLVTFTTALPSANYVVIGNNGFGTAGGTFPRAESIVLSHNQTTTQFLLSLVNSSTGAIAASGFNTGSYPYAAFVVFG